MLLDREVTLIIKDLLKRFCYERILDFFTIQKNRELSILCRLFFNNDYVKISDLEKLLGTDVIDIFLKKDIFRCDRDFYYSLIKITPVKISSAAYFYFISTSIPFYKNLKSRVYIGADSCLLSEDITGLFSKKHYEKGLDLCCGSGIQALTLSRFCSSVTGVDINPQAIVFAGNNSLLNDIEHVKFIQSDLYKNVEDKYDIIVSNPPFGFFPDTFKSWLPGFGGELGIEIPLTIIEGFPGYLSHDGKGFLCLSSPVIDGKEPFLEKVKDMYYGKNFSIKARIIEEAICPDMLDFHREKRIAYFKYYHILFEHGVKPSFTVETFPLWNKIFCYSRRSFCKLMTYYNKYKQKKDAIFCEKLLVDAKNARSYGYTEKAEMMLKKILTINPYHIEAHMTLGEEYLNRGFFIDAIHYFKDLVDLCPDMILPYCQLASAYMYINKDKGGEVLEKALSLAKETQDGEMEHKIKQILRSVKHER
ncbi:MAG: methyltransferase [Candidatus Eremiobacterota bacterium]